MEIACFILVILPWLVNSLGEDAKHVQLHVTRHSTGDLFKPEGRKQTECQQETCVGLSSGTARAASTSDSCKCQCHNHLPTFREDLRICVDDIHECVLAPFVGGSTTQSIPFVFLPLKGQIIHPSKEISFTGIQTPVCAVSGAKFLTENGWLDLRNPIDADVPFRLFRDEGRTYLQWIGEAELRAKMSGRLVLVYLMCRELATKEQQGGPALFSPCVAFRVVGSSSKYLNNVSEVAFSLDAHSASNGTDNLSISQYIAITICSILLGLIYVASILLYLYMRKRNRDTSIVKTDDNLTNSEEGIIKNNPLLTMTAHFPTPDPLYSDSSNSDTDITPDILQHHDERLQSQTTAALVHSQFKRNSSFKNLPTIDTSHQDSSASIEKLPEENVSIVETLEGREDRPDNFKSITGTSRRKLYFNPAYFEPQLLVAPPPAALEFLSKIREVITIAKQKMATKRFTPSLMGIPEEDSTYALEPSHEPPQITRRNSIISLKRENSRRQKCTGCPGCDFQNFSERIPELTSLAACFNCSTTSNNSDSKQISIRKWLEDVPIVKNIKDTSDLEPPLRPPKRIRSPTRSLPSADGVSSPTRALSPRPVSEKARSPEGSPRKRNKAKAPQPPQKQNNNNGGNNERGAKNLPPPDMIHEAMVVDKNEETTKGEQIVNDGSPTTQRLTDDSDATTTTTTTSRKKKSDYETDSLERLGGKSSKNGYNTPSEYGDISSSQPSPSLSTALPMDEEMTIRNAIFNKNTGNMTISKINVDMLQQQQQQQQRQQQQDDDDHDYELIILKKGTLKKHDLCHLPELLQKANGYNLVSEVYVNNGYNYSSAPSTASNSSCSTMETRAVKVRYDETVEKPGKLLIKVEDCPDNYLPINDSDSFEPDTLDRKPGKCDKMKLCTDYIDSLERPARQILLQSKGSFKKDPSDTTISDNTSNFNRAFGSLREIYEAKTKGLKQQQLNENNDTKLLTLEDRHSKRQRRMTISNGHIPDVIPPPLNDNTPIYEHPKPPRKVFGVIVGETDGKLVVKPPPLPPKNANGRSTSVQNMVDSYQSSGTPGTQTITVQICNGSNKIARKSGGGPREDSGYLSTDSNDSKRDHNNNNNNKDSDSEESLEDGHSESGAESIETHSVYFDNFKKPNPYRCYSISTDHSYLANQIISDSETVNYVAAIIQ